MREYYGTKRVQAERDDKPGCQDSLGGIIAESQEGYKVVYPDGYTSWLPRDVFEAAYRPSDRMDFAGALTALREGRAMCRAGWGNPEYYIWLAKSPRGDEMIWDSTNTAASSDLFDLENVLATDWQIAELSA